MTVQPARAWSAHLWAGGLCLGSGILAFALVGSEMAPAIFWPPAGLALGAVLVWGWRVLPAALAGAAAAALLWDMHAHDAALLALAAGAQAALGALLLRRSGFDGRLAKLADLIKLILHGGLLAGLAASGFSYLALADTDWFWQATPWRGAGALLFAHILSVVVCAPILICRPTQSCPRPLGRPWEPAAAWTLLLLAALLLAHPTLFGLAPAAFRPYPLLPLLLWLALRARPRHTALGVATVYAVAVSGGHWGAENLFPLLPDVKLFPIHGFVFVMAVTFLALAVLMAARGLAEDALRTSEARLRNVIGLIRNCLWETDAGGRFVRVDHHAESVFALPAAAMLGRRPEELWPEGLGPAMRGLFATTLEQREPHWEAQNYRRPDGVMAYLETNCAPLMDGDGRHLGWQGITSEVSERKQAEQAQLARAVAHKDALIREVHHRIKNNLQTVVGLLRREAARHPEARPAIERAITQVRSVAVVHGLHGRVTEHAILLCELLPAIVRGVSELTGMPIALGGVRPGSGGLQIKDNETVAVALILNELVTNAVKHAAADGGGPPSVTLLREGEAGRILIGNAGSLPQGFDFQRGAGLGAGLGLVKALCPDPGMAIAYAQAGGRVRVAARIAAPVLQTAAPRPASAEAAASPGRSSGERT